MRRARRKAKKQQSDERSNKVGCRLGAAALALRSRPDVRHGARPLRPLSAANRTWLGAPHMLF